MLAHVQPEQVVALIKTRDKYLSTPESEFATISVTHKEYMLCGNFEKTEIHLEEDESDLVKITYDPYGGRKVDFTIRPPQAKDEVLSVKKTTVVVEEF